MIMTWRKSTWSMHNGSCVEAASWRKPAASLNHGACLQAGHGPGVIGIRDSQLGAASLVLEVTPAAWARLLGRLRESPR